MQWQAKVLAREGLKRTRETFAARSFGTLLLIGESSPDGEEAISNNLCSGSIAKMNNIGDSVSLP
jgi:hypothetical protein